MGDLKSALHSRGIYSSVEIEKYSQTKVQRKNADLVVMFNNPLHVSKPISELCIALSVDLLIYFPPYRQQTVGGKSMGQSPGVAGR